MAELSEWLPNPRGADREGEWIELWNETGATADLRGFRLETEAGKGFVVGDVSLRPGETFVLSRAKTGLTLRNRDGAIVLKRPDGTEADRAVFAGDAPEGKSFGRHGELFLFGDPTPGASNGPPPVASLASLHYPSRVPLNPSLSGGDFFGLMVGSGVLIAALVTFFLKQDENLSELFFPRDREAGQ